ncbi:MAG: competence/damage-inducible protein A [Bacteroidales bacterium]|nr:competence/damage-inducible protein A [Bacteroidales bacterium]
MKAEIITIGDEILIGQINDTNSQYLASKLNQLGFNVTQITSISDTQDAITSILDERIPHTDLLIFTGGLGPTNDDITKNTLADYFGANLVRNKDVLFHVEEILTSRGIEVGEINRQQADVPDNCEVLFNHHGTAPGMLFRYDDTYIVSFPGVPFEMKPLFENELAPILKEEFELPVRLFKTLHVAGVPESVMATRLEEFEKNLPAQVGLAYLPKPGVLRLRLSVHSLPGKEANQLLEQQCNKLLPLLGDDFFGYDHSTIQKSLGQLLNSANATLATAESCSGGNIARLITSIPGCSSYYKGSVVAYSNEIKQSILDVPGELLITHGAVSKEVVEEMSQRVRQKFGTDYGIATSGIAGPDGGTPEKPVGTIWISVASKLRTVSKCYSLGDHRGRNIERTSMLALNMLRKLLVNSEKR